MMHRSRERCNLYTRVYPGTQPHVVQMHTVYLYPHGSAPLGHKELLAPILLQSYQRHLSVRRASFHPSLRPPMSDRAVYQLRTIRNISPLSSPLCLRRFFSRKTRFYRYPCASEPLPRYGAC